jgi:hypothetical protein
VPGLLLPPPRPPRFERLLSNHSVSCKWQNTAGASDLTDAEVDVCLNWLVRTRRQRASRRHAATAAASLASLLQRIPTPPKLTQQFLPE